MGALADYVWLRVRRGPMDRRQRADWLHRHCGRVLPRLGVETQVEGTRPSAGLVVSNHLGYLDILVFAAVFPCVFVAKSEVRFWPLIGFMARMAGTVFVDRESSADSRRVAGEMAVVLREGLPVVLFPEGRSSDGSQVLRFHTALFEPAVAAQQPVTPAHIGYEISEGTVANDVAYWGDMTLPPHVVRLFSIERVKAYVQFGKAAVYDDRKQAAAETQAAVETMHERSNAGPSIRFARSG